MTGRHDAADDARAATVQQLTHAAAVLRSETFEGHPLNELREGPFIRFGVARLLDTVAQALDDGQPLAQPVLDAAQQIAVHALANRPGRPPS
jgi:hypothetical protein